MYDEDFLDDFDCKKGQFACKNQPVVVITFAWSQSDHYKRRPLYIPRSTGRNFGSKNLKKITRTLQAVEQVKFKDGPSRCNSGGARARYRSKNVVFVRFSLYLGPEASYKDGDGLNRFSVEKYMKHDTPYDEEISPYIYPETTHLMAKENGKDVNGLEEKLGAGDHEMAVKLELEEAVRLGAAKLAEDEAAVKRATKILPNTPSYRHFRLVSVPERYSNITRLGQLSDQITMYFVRNKPEIARNLSSVSVAESEEFVDYCRLESEGNCPPMIYRTLDGSCNNLHHPRDWGTAMRPFLRLIPPDYCDGLSTPRCGLRGDLPPARDVTLKLHRANYESDHKFNFMFAVWGQFIDHDITATAVTKIVGGEMASCCGNAQMEDCFPVRLSQDDPIFVIYNTSCMEFVRSAAAPRCVLGPREQMNQVTSYLDGSVIYGATEELADRLRSFKGGRLTVSTTPDGRHLLPVSTDPADGCNRQEEANKGRYCFLTGDSRANENLHLTTLHLIMVRQHNRIASSLLKVNPHWDDEKTFQEAKRIVSAQIQHITYKEFLEPLLGQKVMEKHNLNVRGEGHGTVYDATTNPTIANSFATSAFRFAHSLLPGLMKSYESTSPDSLTLLRKILFNPFPLYAEGNLDRILLSAVGTSVQSANRFFSTEVTQHLFEEPQNDTKGNPKLCGLDLVSLNIQRGRDHGLPSYSKWREFCSLPPLASFEDLRDLMDEESILAIKALYNSVDDVDLYSGSLSENPMKGSILGPTATCLISDQFRRIKFGDRFWYDSNSGPHSFSDNQVKEIKKTTLAEIVCANSDSVTEVPPNLLMFSSTSNRNVDCKSLENLNFGPWIDS